MRTKRHRHWRPRAAASGTHQIALDGRRLRVAAEDGFPTGEIWFDPKPLDYAEGLSPQPAAEWLVGKGLLDPARQSRHIFGRDEKAVDLVADDLSRDPRGSRS